MSNIFEIKKDKLGNKLGEIVPFNYVLQGKDKNIFNVFTAYIGGTIPVKIKSKLTYQKFCKIC